MNSQQLSPRLEEVAKLVTKYSQAPIRLADIGSDHAYLPCYLALKQKIEFAIAGEVVKGPFQSAQQEVAMQNLNQMIDVRLGSGLNVLSLEDQINAITICGMGGVLIRDILNENQSLLENSLLVLQPNMASEQLRSWLNGNSFAILDEVVIEDNQRYYEIIVAKKSVHVEQLSDIERLVGPINLRHQSDAFRIKWQHELTQYQNLEKNLLENLDTAHPKVQEIQEKIKHLLEVLK